MTKWADFVVSNNVLSPQKLYMYVITFWQVLSDPELYCNTKVYFRDIHMENNEVFLLFSPTAQVIKLDPAFVLSFPDWVPPGSRHRFLLLQDHHIQKGRHVLLQPAEWKISPIAREQLIMKNLPDVQRLAYMTVKVVKDFVTYDKDDGVVKTYDIKNALFFEMEKTPSVLKVLAQNLQRDPTPPGFYSQPELTDSMLQQVYIWVQNIQSSLKSLNFIRKFYFRFGRTGITDLFVEMLDAHIEQNTTWMKRRVY